MSSSRLPVMIMSLALLAGCTTPVAVPGASREPSTTTSTRPTAPETAEPSKKPPRNDLKSGKLDRRLKTGDVAVKVDYATSLPIRDWTATTSKPFAVTATADMIDNEQSQKIYLSKLTITLDPRDDAGAVDPPLPLTDEAAIVPGFLVSSPASYRQEFFIPSLVAGASTLTLRLRYELLLESAQAANSETKDYSRRTVTDIVVVPIAAG
jgi:hypothetical protein